MLPCIPKRTLSIQMQTENANKQSISYDVEVSWLKYFENEAAMTVCISNIEFTNK